MPRARLLLLLIAVAAALAVAATAAARVPTTVRASLAHRGSPQQARLTIVRDGRRAYDGLVRARLCGADCTTVPVPPGRTPLLVADLEGTHQPDVVLGLYSGGAHCCFIDQVFRYFPAQRAYVKTEHDFLDAGARLERLGGRWIFASADARIADWGFTDFADSGAPIQNWRFSGGRFIDVTRQFPAALRRDAARWLQFFNRHPANDVGFIAAWAADEDLLGQTSLVSGTLAADAKAGRLHSALGLPRNSQAAFVTELQNVLRRLGYTR